MNGSVTLIRLRARDESVESHRSRGAGPGFLLKHTVRENAHSATSQWQAIPRGHVLRRARPWRLRCVHWNKRRATALQCAGSIADPAEYKVCRSMETTTRESITVRTSYLTYREHFRRIHHNLLRGRTREEMGELNASAAASCIGVGGGATRRFISRARVTEKGIDCTLYSDPYPSAAKVIDVDGSSGASSREVLAPTRDCNSSAKPQRLPQREALRIGTESDDSDACASDESDCPWRRSGTAAFAAESTANATLACSVGYRQQSSWRAGPSDA